MLSTQPVWSYQFCFVRSRIWIRYPPLSSPVFYPHCKSSKVQTNGHRCYRGLASTIMMSEKTPEKLQRWTKTCFLMKSACCLCQWLENLNQTLISSCWPWIIIQTRNRKRRKLNANNTINMIIPECLQFRSGLTNQNRKTVGCESSCIQAWTDYCYRDLVAEVRFRTFQLR